MDAASDRGLQGPDSIRTRKTSQQKVWQLEFGSPAGLSLKHLHVSVLKKTNRPGLLGADRSTGRLQSCVAAVLNNVHACQKNPSRQVATSLQPVVFAA